MFTLDLPRSLEKRLFLLSMTSGRTIQHCAREAIMDYVEGVEERCLARIRAESILAMREHSARPADGACAPEGIGSGDHPQSD